MELTAAEVRRLDLNAQDLGVPIERLMANAGQALAKEVEREARGRTGRPIVIVCGAGNNGGDGLAAAARLLARGHDVRVVLVKRPRTAAALAHLARLPRGRVRRWPGGKAVLRGAGVIVDCMLGVGASGPPRSPYDKAVRAINARRRAARIVACDVPTGMASNLAVHPHRTVTFHARKAGMDARCGTIRVAPIGIPRGAAGIGLGDLAAGYPVPDADGHKGDHGRVLVVGGGPFTGAPHYAGLAALRTGADLVLVAAPADAARTLASWGPDLIVHASNPGTHFDALGAASVRDLLGHVDAVVLGCGLGQEDVTRDAAGEVLAECARRGLPVVVDADGLDAVTPAYLAGHGRRTVLTPHGREFQDLAGWKPTTANVSRYARERATVVLRKGRIDVVAGPDTARPARGGHVAMTVGGTGDALAGIVGCLLAKGAGAFEAACAGAYVAKRAGEAAAAVRSFGATAADLIEAIPTVLVRLEAALRAR